MPQSVASTREARDVLGMAKKVKSELDKVYRSDTEYDVTIDDDAHADALERMPHVTVGGTVVGYEESSSLSLNGTSYRKHFRASWRHDDRVIGVSYYTQQDMDLKAFVALLEWLIPIVERQL